MIEPADVRVFLDDDFESAFLYAMTQDLGEPDCMCQYLGGEVEHHPESRTISVRPVRRMTIALCQIHGVPGLFEQIYGPRRRFARLRRFLGLS
jgi:hypothetical protein